jgi:hypothetical protein
MKKPCILFFSLLTFVSFSQTLEVVYSETTDLSDELKNLDLPEMEGVNNLLIQLAYIRTSRYLQILNHQFLILR